VATLSFNSESSQKMNDAKTPKKTETVAKPSQSTAPVATKLASGPASGKTESPKTESPKTEGSQTEAGKTDQSKSDPTASEAPASDSPAASAGEPAAAPKSASQSSISHFSSVSTPEYRSGWNKIFGTSPVAAPAQPTGESTSTLPADFSLPDAQISSALRAKLAEALHPLVEAQGIRLSETQETVEVSYTIVCHVVAK
jgi:hypothetical protein